MDKIALKVFPYRQDAKKHFFPIIPLRVHHSNITIDSAALVDSGATVSVFKKEVAQQLGVKIEKGIEIYLGGVGGHIKGYIHRLRMQIAGKEFLCPIVFSHEYFVSFNLLGREGFFNKFRIIFEEKKNHLKLE